MNEIKSDSTQNVEKAPFPQQDVGYLTEVLGWLGTTNPSVQEKLIQILKILQNNELKPQELLDRSQFQKSTFYYLLRLARKYGMARKEQGYWRLNSEFSADCIKYAKFWADFAGITKNQPEKIKEFVNALI